MLVKRYSLYKFVKVFSAAAVTPGAPSILVFLISIQTHIELSDHWDNFVFLDEARLFYLTSLTCFILVYAVSGSAFTHAIVGIFASWPAWLFLISLPSDASTGPLNPQFFLAPSTAILGLASGLLFFALTRRSRNRASAISASTNGPG